MVTVRHTDVSDRFGDCRSEFDRLGRVWHAAANGLGKSQAAPTSAAFAPTGSAVLSVMSRGRSCVNKGALRDLARIRRMASQGARLQYARHSDA